MGDVAERRGSRPPIAETVAVLASRLDAMEEAAKNRKPTRRERFAAWAGVLGLCISILTGGFTLIDRMVIAPKAAALARFREAVRGITTINQDVNTRAAAASTPAMAAVIGSSRNLEKWNFLQQAQQALPSIEQEVSAQEYYVLAGEAVNMNKHAVAIDYAGRAEALSRANGDNTELSEILRLQAQVISMAQGAGGVETSRRKFAEARAALDDVNSFGAPYMRARAASEAIMLEAYWGDCALIPPLLADYSFQRDRSDVTPPLRQVLQQTLEGQLRGQNRCVVQLPALPASAPGA